MGAPDPKGMCQAQSASTCGEMGGTCNGSGACTTWPTGAVCAAALCQGNTLVKQATCAGGLCAPGTPATVSCTPYKCAGGACTTSCAQDADCAGSSFYCNAGQCAAKLGTGSACGANDQCKSGNCTGGVCQ
jgi:hypothetical protein